MFNNINSFVCAFINLIILCEVQSRTHLFPHGKLNGDIIVIDSKAEFASLTTGNADDGLKAVQIPKTPFFGKKRETLIQISTNGYIIFGNSLYNSPFPRDFPVQYQNTLVPIIATFWTDLIFKTDSILSYQIHTKENVIQRIKNTIIKKYAEDPFNATHALIVTWNNAKLKNQLIEGSLTFQLVLASNGKSTFVIMLYEDLPLEVIAGVGYQESLNIFSHEFSMEKALSDKLLRTSNIDEEGVVTYQVAQEEISCAGKPNGRNSHPSDCEKYIICFNNEMQRIVQCSTNATDVAHYDPRTEECVPPEEYPCNQGAPQECFGKGEKMIAHRTDCKKIVHCRFNKVVKISTCPDKTVFHPDLMVCVFATQYKCNKGQQPQNLCNDKIDGNYKDPKSCDHFIQCSNGLLHKIRCPAGLHFVPSEDSGPGGHCDWPFRANCEKGCNDKIDGNYKDPKSCDHFIQCSNGLVHKTRCPAGLHFVPSEDSGPGGHCDFPFRANCQL